MAFYPAVILPASAATTATADTSKAPPAQNESPRPYVQPRGRSTQDTIFLGIGAAVSTALLGTAAWYAFGHKSAADKPAPSDANKSPNTNTTPPTNSEIKPAQPTTAATLISENVPLRHVPSDTHFYHEEQVGALCGKHSLNAALHSLGFKTISTQSYRAKLLARRTEYTDRSKDDFTGADELQTIIDQHLKQLGAAYPQKGKEISLHFHGALTEQQVGNSRAILSMSNDHWVSYLRDKNNRWCKIDSLSSHQNRQNLSFQEIQAAFIDPEKAQSHHFIVFPPR